MAPCREPRLAVPAIAPVTSFVQNLNSISHPKNQKGDEVVGRSAQTTVGSAAAFFSPLAPPLVA